MNQLYLDQKPGRTALLNGEELLFFSGYNYLGINADREFKELVLEGIDKYGWLFPSSRISNTRLSIYEECENLLSELTNSEETVLFPSGFSAGQAVISCYKNSINNAPGSHPAILQQPSEFENFDDWRKNFLTKTTDKNSILPQVFASDSVNPLTATLYDFSFVKEAKQPVILIIDDSHGIGIVGNEGKSASAAVPKSDQLNYIFTYSLSKAFGISGGAVSCSKQVAATLRKTPEYAAVTPLSPALVYAFVKGRHIYQQQREKLFANISYFASRVKGLRGIKFDAGFPVFILPPELDESFFYRHKILISSFAYPDPEGENLNRIVLNALHTQEDLDKLATVVKAGLSRFFQ